MAIFENKQRKSGRTPTEKVQLTENLVAAIWDGKREDGETEFGWDLSRLTRDGSRTCQTKTVEHLLEVPEFVAKLSEQFANSSCVPMAIRKKLAAQAGALAECLELISAGDDDKANGRARENRVFNLAG